MQAPWVRLAFLQLRMGSVGEEDGGTERAVEGRMRAHPCGCGDAAKSAKQSVSANGALRTAHSCSSDPACMHGSLGWYTIRPPSTVRTAPYEHSNNPHTSDPQWSLHHTPCRSSVNRMGMRSCLSTPRLVYQRQLLPRRQPHTSSELTAHNNSSQEPGDFRSCYPWRFPRNQVGVVR